MEEIVTEHLKMAKPETEASLALLSRVHPSVPGGVSKHRSRSQSQNAQKSPPPETTVGGGPSLIL